MLKTRLYLRSCYFSTFSVRPLSGLAYQSITRMMSMQPVFLPRSAYVFHQCLTEMVYLCRSRMCWSSGWSRPGPTAWPSPWRAASGSNYRLLMCSQMGWQSKCRARSASASADLSWTVHFYNPLVLYFCHLLDFYRTQQETEAHQMVDRGTCLTFVKVSILSTLNQQEQIRHG